MRVFFFPPISPNRNFRRLEVSLGILGGILGILS